MESFWFERTFEITKASGQPGLLVPTSPRDAARDQADQGHPGLAGRIRDIQYWLGGSGMPRTSLAGGCGWEELFFVVRMDVPGSCFPSQSIHRDCEALLPHKGFSTLSPDPSALQNVGVLNSQLKHLPAPCPSILCSFIELAESRPSQAQIDLPSWLCPWLCSRAISLSLLWPLCACCALSHQP